MPDRAERLSRIMPLIQHAVSHLGVQSTESGRRYGLTNSRIVALATVLHSGELTMSELASAIDYPRPLATRLVDELVERGLLERKNDPSDRRRVLVSITAQGLQVFEDVHREAAAILEHVIGAMSDSDADALIRGLESLLGVLHDSSGPLRPHAHNEED